MSDHGRVAYLIGFSAPPVLHLDEFIRLLASEGWDTYVVLSPTAATWANVMTLTEVSGNPVRVEPRLPHEQDPLPPAEVVIAAPITFNSLNKWASGVSDTLALGLLNESIGLKLPVTAAPCVKSTLQIHPAYEQSVRILSSVGVTFLDPAITTPNLPGAPTMDWAKILPLQAR